MDFAGQVQASSPAVDIAGHISQQMLRHYSHMCMEAKRNALEAIVKS